jgi:complement component 1 Q subcomponent-binding protein, mitochondrial
MCERYLEERGVNSALASFISDYAELKEQREYVNWLKNLKTFIDN